MSNRVYEEWKLLRNLLSKFDRVLSLSVIRLYSIWSMDKSKGFTSDMTVHPYVFQKQHMILSWDLVTIAREIILSSPDNTSSPYDMRNGSLFLRVMGRLKEIENLIGSQYINKDNVLTEVSLRLPHRQFPYQDQRASFAHAIPYFKIYNHPEINSLIEKNTGLNLQKIYTIGLLYWQNYFKYFGIAVKSSSPIELKGITDDDVKNFMALFACDIDVMKEMIKTDINRFYDDRFMYSYNPLRAKPLLRAINDGVDSYICPIPQLVYWKVTKGLYYDLMNIKGFTELLGESFETYIGDVCTEILDLDKFQIYPEVSRTKNLKLKRCDWVIDSIDSFLLLECKAKRLPLNASVSISDLSTLDAQLEILADAIGQCYRSYLAFKHSQYTNPNYIFDSSKMPFVIVTTLEDWYLSGTIFNKLDLAVRKYFNNYSLPLDILDSVNYTVLPMKDLETLTHVMNIHGIKPVLRPFFDDPSFNNWNIRNYLTNRFKKDFNSYVYPFLNEESTLFTS